MYDYELQSDTLFCAFFALPGSAVGLFEFQDFFSFAYKKNQMRHRILTVQLKGPEGETCAKQCTGLRVVVIRCCAFSLAYQFV